MSFRTERLSAFWPSYKTALICALLSVLVLATFWSATANKFISFDDPVYVTANQHVQGGFSWENLKWAFSSSEAANWHPITWLSHTLDCKIFGLNAWGHHFGSIMLHWANTVLLFLVLKRATGAIWRSFVVAAFFGLHPLRVESVAWVAERKDVLSMFFFLLTVWAYAEYVSSVECRVSGGKSEIRKPQSEGNPIVKGNPKTDERDG